MAAASPKIATSIEIKGTDIDEAAVEAYRAPSTSSSWPAEGLVMDANALSFPDETFTHSIGNAMAFLTRNNGIDAIKEMRRTLKPGGTLLVNCFAYSPHLGAVREASRPTRVGGVGGTLPAWDSFENRQDLTFIAGILEAGGFKKGR
jgi:ubiquinone/menaquinone biosynthesis C-methylase UbiE